MLDLDAIQARADAATPGPWRLSDGGWGEYVQDSEGRELWALRRTPKRADAEFVAHARMDVPALLAELRAARQVVAEAQTQGHGPPTDNPNCKQCRAVAAYLKLTEGTRQ